MRIGNYDISTDEYQWVISKVTTITKSKKGNNGKESLTPIAFFTKLENVVDYITESTLQKDWDDTKTLRDNVNDSLTKLIKEEICQK